MDIISWKNIKVLKLTNVEDIKLCEVIMNGYGLDADLISYFPYKIRLLLLQDVVHGIGLEIAKGFILNGAHVIGISRSKPKKKLILNYFLNAILLMKKK